MENIQFIRKISQHQEWLATWEAECYGEHCLIRVVQEDSSPMNPRVLRILDRQIEIYRDLLPEDQERMVFFSQKFGITDTVENISGTVYCRKWIEGETLESQLEPEPMMWQSAVQRIEQIAELVRTAHERYNIWHGDLKPENIISSGGNLYLIDWDAMQFRSECQNLNEKTISVESMGTPYYMAPEQCAGMPGTPQSDVYALGVMFYRFLTGRLPFAETNVLELWTKKQREPVPSILAEHAGLNIPTELGLLVDKTLALDSNLRTQTVVDFLSSLRYAAQLADPAAFPDLEPVGGVDVIHSVSSENHRTIPTPPPLPERVSKKHTNDDVRPTGSIVLVGHTQSGKTVLAAGLYATSCETFTVTAMDETSQTFAINTKSVLDDGNWPAATSKGQVENLRFKLFLQDGGIRRASVVSFKEYAGERMNSPNYCQEIIGSPTGVLLLMNPGAFAARNSRERNQVITEMKASIEYMTTLPHRPAVALVITAADRLQGDLKDYGEKFQKLVTEIRDTLSLSKLVWKQFEVSVCKPLKDQLKPELDPQNIQEPFIWLLRRERAVKRTRNAVRWAKYTAAALFLAFCCFLLASHQDGRKVAELNGRMNEIRKKFSSVTTAETKNTYSQTLEEAIKAFPEKGFWFDSKKQEYLQLRTELLDKADLARRDLLEYLVRNPANPALPLDSCTDALAKFRAWEPHLKKNQEMKKELESVIAGILPSIMPKCIKWIESVKGDEFQKRYDQIQKFVAESASINKEIAASFRENIVPLKTAVLENRINNFSGSSEQLGTLAQECLLHAKRDMAQDFTKTELASSLLKLIRAKVEQACAECEQQVKDLKPHDNTKLQYFEANIASWGFAAADVTSLTTRIRDFRISLNSVRHQTEQDVVQRFITGINGIAADEALTRLKQWYLEQSGRISDTSQAEIAVFNLVWSSLWARVNKCIGSTNQIDYTQLKQLCASIKASPSPVIQNSKAFLFANNYVNWYDNNRQIQVKLVKMEAKCDYSKAGYIYRINGVTGRHGDRGWSSQWHWDEYKVIDYTDSSWTTIEPWGEYKISVDCYIDDTWAWDTHENWEFRFLPGSRTDSIREYIDLSPENTCIRMTFQVHGTTVRDLWDEVTR